MTLHSRLSHRGRREKGVGAALACDSERGVRVLQSPQRFVSDSIRCRRWVSVSVALVPVAGALPVGFEELLRLVSDSIRVRRWVSVSVAVVPDGVFIVLGDEGFPGTALPAFVPLVVPAPVPPAGAPLPDGRFPEVTPPGVPPLPAAPLPPAPWA